MATSISPFVGSDASNFTRQFNVETIGGDQRQRLAEMLRSQALNLPQGQMVSGWYVAPNWSQNLNQALQTGLGVYMGTQLDKERAQKTAEALKRFEGVEEQVPMENIPGIGVQDTLMAEGQSRPEGAPMQTMANPQMMQQRTRMRPLTQDEQDMALLNLAQINPQVGGIYGSLLGTRASREEKRQAEREARAWREEENIKADRRHKENLALTASLRQGPQPQAPVAVIDPKTGREMFVAPSQAYGMAPARSAQPMSAAQQKEVIEADEIVQSSQNVINTLNKALDINPLAYSGYGAKGRAVVRSNLPGESLAADATINLENMMQGQALESLKTIFGGNPTEGERKILVELQASADKTPKQREDIIKRGIAAAQNRLNFNAQKAEALRGGTYMRPGYSPVTAQPQQTSGMPSQSAIDAEIARRQGR